MGKVPELSSVVTLSLSPDAQNETPVINITGIVMDSPTAGWKCEPCPLHGPLRARSLRHRSLPRCRAAPAGNRADLSASCLRRFSSPAPIPCPCHGNHAPTPGLCRPTTRDDCACIPNAVLLGPASFRVMPQWRRFTLPGPVVDKNFQVRKLGCTHATGFRTVLNSDCWPNDEPALPAAELSCV